MVDDALDCRIFLHHIGARGFGVVMNPPWSFEDSLVHVLYEADPECAAAMIAENKKANLHVLPYCISDADKTRPFYIANNPYASSLLKPNECGFNNYCEVELSGKIGETSVQDARYDAIYANENRTVRRLELETRSLDSLLNSKLFPAGSPPDFLSMDTQGSEYEILLGAPNTLESTLAIGSEISFQPMYDGQKLFSAIFDLLQSHGFMFVRFTHLFETSSFRAPVGQRSAGLVSFGDALFIRNVQTLNTGNASSLAVYLKALKLAFLALNLGLVEHAMQALAYARNHEPDEHLSRELRQHSYVRFLHELASAANAMQPSYLSTERAALVDLLRAREIKHNDQVLLRQRDEIARQRDEIARQQERIAVMLGTSPRHAVMKLARHPLRTAALILRGHAPQMPLTTSDPAALHVTDNSNSTAPATVATRFESVLAEHGFTELANIVRERRLRALPFVQP
jgi:FkbM family methyltransferase